MKKIIIRIVIIGLITMSLIIGLNAGKKVSRNLGSSLSDNIYGEGTSYSTTSIGIATTTTSILAKNANRQWAAICNYGSGIVSIYEAATSSVTGKYIDGGYPIASSTVYNHCYYIDTNHLYTGPVSGIADVATIIRIIEK